MTRITAQDAADLSEWVRRLYDATTLDGAAAVCVEAMTALVPCDWSSVSFTPHSLAGKRRFWSPESAAQHALVEPFRAYYQEHPIWRAWWEQLAPTAHSLTELVPSAQLHNTGVYQEVFRPLRIERLLGVAMAGGLDFALGIIRSRGRDFSPRDRLLMELLAPHLSQAARNLARAGGLTLDGCPCPVGEVAIVALDAALSPRHLSPGAGVLLRRYFGEPPPARSLPFAISDWLANRDGGDDSLEVASGSFRLRVRWLGGLHANLSHLVLCETPAPALATTAAASTGLTAREREVAAAIARGRTNAQIGDELAISPRTVKKHVENIFQKVDVRTRSGLAAWVLGGRAN